MIASHDAMGLLDRRDMLDAGIIDQDIPFDLSGIAEAVDHDGSALGRQDLGIAQANARGGTGDQRSLTFQKHEAYSQAVWG